MVHRGEHLICTCDHRSRLRCFVVQRFAAAVRNTWCETASTNRAAVPIPFRIRDRLRSGSRGGSGAGGSRRRADCRRHNRRRREHDEHIVTIILGRASGRLIGQPAKILVRDLDRLTVGLGHYASTMARSPDQRMPDLGDTRHMAEATAARAIPVWLSSHRPWPSPSAWSGRFCPTSTDRFISSVRLASLTTSRFKRLRRRNCRIVRNIPKHDRCLTLGRPLQHHCQLFDLRCLQPAGQDVRLFASANILGVAARQTALRRGFLTFLQARLRVDWTVLRWPPGNATRRTEAIPPRQPCRSSKSRRILRRRRSFRLAGLLGRASTTAAANAPPRTTPPASATPVRTGSVGSAGAFSSSAITREYCSILADSVAATARG